MELCNLPAKEKQVIVIGGSVVGLACAMAFKRQGFNVTVIDKDVSPSPDITPSNSSEWPLKGVFHALHPHVRSEVTFNGTPGPSRVFLEFNADGMIQHERFFAADPSGVASGS